MNDIIKKVSYLKGLADGLDIDKDTNEAKLILEIINVLEEVSYVIEDLTFRQDMLLENLEEIDDDLLNLEDYVYDLDSSSLAGYDDFDFEDFEDIYSDILSSEDYDDIDEFYLDNDSEEEEENEYISSNEEDE